MWPKSCICEIYPLKRPRNNHKSRVLNDWWLILSLCPEVLQDGKGIKTFHWNSISEGIKMANYSQILHVLGLQAPLFSNLCSDFTSFSLTRMKLAISKRETQGWLRALRMNLHWHTRQGSTKMRQPAGMFFIDRIFNYFHFASSPNGKEMKIKYKPQYHNFRN